MHTLVAAFVMAASVAISSVGVASGDSADQDPVRRVNPDYPDRLVKRRIEGWAAVTFTRTTNGAVANPFVSDSSGEPAIDRSVLAAVSRWGYAPLAEGARCGVTVRLSLMLGARTRPSFVKAHARIQGALARGEIENAAREIELLEPRGISEIAHRHGLEADLAAGRKDLEAEAIALSRSAGFNDRMDLGDQIQARRDGFASPIGVDAALRVLRRRLSVLVQAKQFGSALSLFRMLKAANAATPELASAGAQLEALPGGLQQIETSGRTRRLAAIEDAPSIWSAPLLRERFRVEPASGELRRIDVCCQGAMHTAAPNADEIRVPLGAGACRVFVFGDEGARFTLVEIPNNSQAAGAPAAAP